MVSSMLTLGPTGQLPEELRKDVGCYGAVAPKYGEIVEVEGPNQTKVSLRLFFLLDVFASAPFHPRNKERSKLPKRWRVVNPLELCKDVRNREEHFEQSTSLKEVKNSGNVALVSSGAFSEKQYRTGIKQLRHLYGDDVQVTVIDLRKEDHFFGDGEPFSQHTFTNHQNMSLTAQELIKREKDFVKKRSKGVKVWARRIDNDLSPLWREFQSLKTEEDLVRSEKNISYIRLPLTDHTALDSETAKRFFSIVKETVDASQKEKAPVQVLWLHCLGGQGRASSMTLAAHVFIRQLLPNTPRASFEELAKHIWSSGGKNLSEDPDPKKEFKINGAICRRGCLKVLADASNDSDGKADYIDCVVANIEKYIESNHKIWESQVDPSEFAEQV